MTIDEKARLCVGRDMWFINGCPRLNLPDIMLTDGPHGLRKQSGDPAGQELSKSVPATSFPTGSAMACSFDPELLEQVGAAIGEECRKEDVAVLLGPALNIKRSPLCGRNFEYLSEDPVLAGKLAAALVRGVQSTGTGACLKHFAVNNQETKRMAINAVVDERALMDLYLKGFEIAVRESDPEMVMCSYNRVNGEYSSDNEWLMTDVLRKSWGFGGAVVTDWGAMNDRVAGKIAGTDIEMPAAENAAEDLAAAVRRGDLPEAKLTESAERAVEMMLRYQAAQHKEFTCDDEAHLALARRTATESAVLLKNDGILPGNAEQSIAVIGAFAQTPRYQGGGSSHTTPLRLDSALEAFAEAGVNFDYAPGYPLVGEEGSDELIAQAVETAKGKDIVYIFAGLPDDYESEGADRFDMRMPPCQCRLIEAVAKENPNVVVVLQGGAPFDTPWESRARAILLAYLGGCMGGHAIVDLLLGKANPSGKLAETWPASLKDVPSSRWFPGYRSSVQYRESIYVGYRWFDTAQVPVRWAFGHGLSYTSFDYSWVKITNDGGRITASCTVTNTGNVAGKETVQLYFGKKDSALFRPTKELIGFKKLSLAPGESRTAEFTLTESDFAYWNTDSHTRAVEPGEYTLYFAASSADTRLTATVELEGYGAAAPDLREKCPSYYNVGTQLIVSAEEFEALYAKPLPPTSESIRPFTRNSTLGDLNRSTVGKPIVAAIKAQAAKASDDPEMKKMLESSLMDMPLRALSMMSGGALSDGTLNAVIDLANGKVKKGIGGLLDGLRIELNIKKDKK
jgi:beta-glucosidase